MANFILYCRISFSHSGLLWKRRSCHSSWCYIIWIWRSFPSGQLIKFWPSHFGIFILIISIGFILQSRKTKSGMFYGITLSILAIFILFYDKVTSLLSLTQNVVNFWPFVLMAFGVYVLFFRKK